MHVGLYEFLTACETPATASASLWREGFCMVRAAACDALEAGYRVTVGWRADALSFSPLPSHSRLNLLPVDASNELAALQSLARQTDRLLLVAPEFDRLLQQRSGWVEQAGGCLAGPDSRFIEYASDKQAVSQRLLEADVLVPVAVDASRTPVEPGPWVVKPRFGCGSTDVTLVRDADSLRRLLADRVLDEWQVQRFQPGQAASVAVLCRGDERPWVLPACRQLLSADGRFAYQGGALPLSPEEDRRARALAGAALAASPPTRGYVGVDLVLGPTAREDVVIEINPRLTTSYVGLRVAAGENLAPWLFAAADCPARPPAFRKCSIQFTAEGDVTG